MALLDAKEYDPRPRQRLVRLLIAAVVVVIVFVIVYFFFLRFRGEKNAINNLFSAIEAKNFEKAYGIYNADPNWKQHQDKYKGYTYNQFYLDWGPSGYYGDITSHKIECVVSPEERGFKPPSGVVIVVRINNRADRTESFWVEKKDHSINAPPEKYLCPGSTS